LQLLHHLRDLSGQMWLTGRWWKHVPFEQCRPYVLLKTTFWCYSRDCIIRNICIVLWCIENRSF